MRVLGILAAASLALAPAFVSADEQKSVDETRPAPGPVASQADNFGDELDPDFVVPIGLGVLALGFCVAFCGGDGDDETTTTTTTTTE